MDDKQEQLELSETPAEGRPRKDQVKSPEERTAFLHGVLAGADDTLEKRVAQILNHWPDTRDSDLKLALRYWESFEDYDGGLIEPSDLFEWTRIPSLVRARARVQNQYKLFVASREVRQRRGTLSEEEKQKAVDDTPTYPGFAVALDESGKTSKHLVVAGVWFAHSEELFSITRAFGEWRERNGFNSEFHFSKLDKHRLPLYKQAIEFLLDQAASVSFKALSVPRHGLKDFDSTLEDLFYHLLVEGIRHEDRTGRGPLPRLLQVWKDLEEAGRDRVMLANLRTRLKEASNNDFKGKLALDEFEPVESKDHDIVQMADLFAASLNRVLNREAGSRHPKDEFADYLLERVGMPGGPRHQGRVNDLSVHVQL